MSSTRCLILFFLLAKIDGITAADISILTPENGNHVPINPCINATSTDMNAIVVPVVRSLETREFWIQDRLSPRGTYKAGLYRYKGKITVGRPFLDQSRRYEARLYLDPSHSLQTTPNRSSALRDWPEGGLLSSGIIELVRDDAAGDMCQENPDTIASVSSRGSLLTNLPDTPSNRLSIPPFQSPLSAFFPMLKYLVVIIILAFLIVPKRAQDAIHRIHCWISVTTATLADAYERTTSLLYAWIRSSIGWARSSSITIGASKDRINDALYFLVHGLLLLILSCSVAFIECFVIHTALPFLFGEDGTRDGLSDSFSSGTFTIPFLPDFIKQLLETVTNWHWGYLALSLVLVEMLAGMAVFWRYNPDSLMGFSPKQVYRNRPVPFVLFMLFDSIIAIMAGIRAYEQSTSELPILAGFVSACLAFIMPLILSWGIFVALYYLPTIGAFIVRSAATIFVYVLAYMSILAFLIFAALVPFTLAASVVVLCVVWLGLQLITLISDSFEKIWISLSRVFGNNKAARLIPAFRGLLISLMIILLVAQALEAETPARSMKPEHPIAWIILIDVSRSESPFDFDRAKLYVSTVVDRKVQYQDLVWFLEIQRDAHSISPLAMPSIQGITRRAKALSKTQLDEAKLLLIKRINSLQQTCMSTNLQDPIEQALRIFKDNGQYRKHLMVISDFISDRGDRSVTAEAPKLIDGASASEVQVELIVATPTKKYLDMLKMTPSGHRDIVEKSWISLFKRVGANEISLKEMSSVPIPGERTPALSE